MTLIHIEGVRDRRNRPARSRYAPPPAVACADRIGETPTPARML